jgi:hypothetical protein
MPGFPDERDICKVPYEGRSCLRVHYWFLSTIRLREIVGRDPTFGPNPGLRLLGNRD